MDGSRNNRTSTSDSVFTGGVVLAFRKLYDDVSLFGALDPSASADILRLESPKALPLGGVDDDADKEESAMVIDETSVNRSACTLSSSRTRLNPYRRCHCHFRIILPIAVTATRQSMGYVEMTDTPRTSRAMLRMVSFVGPASK